MKLWKKFAIALASLLVLACVVFGVAVLAFAAFFGDMCGNQILAEYPSPNGKLKAVVFQRDCGAMTGFSTQVSLLRSDRVLENEAGNVFVADTDHGRAPSGAGGGPEVRFRWVSDSAATLQHHELARIFSAEAKVKGVKLEYLPFAAP